MNPAGRAGLVRRLPHHALPRRAALALPALLLGLPGHAAPVPPPFPKWVGRTARLSAEGGVVRLLLRPDGSGALSLRVLFRCRSVPVREWEIAADGLSLRWRRAAVVDPARTVEGHARIQGGALRWAEAREQAAAFEGFEPPEAVQACG
ncbi:MAG TPA: hypothetical protein VE033_12695 [Acetobacteraceae bacterium]|nr:hypothetical protein [Acetobacteraceae bacterium]